ncbi:DNA-binding transcriptional regulator, LysR family [Rhizobiales bacterium GAS191]|nr:DNA-binding transcriptional regulator, LysR family [Rhizobiales bacterium GAS113]SEC88525.1 DNA-binding transcriptional regulator, LysR family [Rhizobiales bacterium GAS191]
MRGSQFAELTAFAAVAELRNFAKAAAQLAIAPPTLSQTIRSLEERLGVRLLNRTTRSVAVTEAGERLLSHLQPVLLGLDQAVEAVNSFRDTPTGRLRLTVIRHAAIAMIAPLIPRFLAQYPEIELEIAADDGHGDIVQGRFDAGIRIGELIDQDMIALRIVEEYRMVAVAAPSYLGDNPPPMLPRELQTHNCIRQRMGWDGGVHPWEFEQAGERIEVAVEGSLIVNDTQLVLSATLDGVGIAYLPEGCLGPHFAAGRLVPLLEDWSVRRSGLFLYYPSRRQIPAPLRAFVAFMRRERKPELYAVSHVLTLGV